MFFFYVRTSLRKFEYIVVTPIRPSLRLSVCHVLLSQSALLKNRQTELLEFDLECHVVL